MTLAKFIAEGIQTELIRIIRKENKIGAGELVNSISHKIEEKGEKLIVQILANEYIIYVDAGRRAGSFPPVDKIRDWVKEKPITPYGDISEDSLVYLIGKKIHDEGIDATNIIQKAIDNFLRLNEDEIAERYGDEVSDEIDKMISKIKF